ncbi:DNA repair protein XRCC3 homolog [Andrographis paniculata]|uniref:DNA repair protein XRCC3 homolog n=1 Tax=Andrographis paniculata TaxID=175694 RepID=UPI0021E70319|nr:DNA repair protein XRCC3 homolog [Andrographis paniculata]XP_051132682.1 DNA repair protein XRCC3 homolog [Andrographis paniculata]XP_051132683.1 DNA repair protein XRCC3 homolog [Andrographis paniculata]XP_051132685.1 DNA repair protein XRCC3 homolog [Andrographis paniculata]XP_051132686.1 DNA repair protein XRCC3 homolog [Andrographis paniculata]XP_051132687.1 DNA repair protein XRCC3 homolog [Andrographis paniculata]XP_051132688.1 DNA repair protein XRCC3 homolog [Andrographis paniculat
MKPEDLLHRLSAQTPKLTVGCPALDRLLGGGIPCESITEIVAESGTGKTQLSLQLLLAVQLPAFGGGLSAASLYLHSEFPFPFRRLHQLSGFYAPNLPTNPLDSIFVQPLHSADHLLDILPRLDNMVPKLNIKLIVIDSIAALFRGEFENTPVELKRRSSMFFKISSKLRFYARKFGLAVVLTNQVVDVMDSSDTLKIGNPDSLFSSGRMVCAALGLSWANCVNTRLFMWREAVRAEEEGQNFENVKIKRFIRVVFAPHLPDSSIEFMIKREGVSGVG